MGIVHHPDHKFFCRTLCAATALLLGACAPVQDREDQAARTTAGVDTAGVDTAAVDSSAIDFVREFYAAYLPRGVEGGLDAVDGLITERPELFAPSLLLALQQDAASRRAAHDEIGGLDFDPFLDSQDPCERYEVVKGTRVGAVVHVDVHAVCQGQRSVAPTVTLVVAHDGRRPLLANVLYPTHGTDLGRLLHRDRAPDGRP